ncbi:MAG: prepilin peptidase [Verrucomicrobiae bacterium]|nr:prepilin peptidase [Verrucomicrobiae bacterium]
MSAALDAVPSWFWTALAAVLGAVVGSFLNVCIHRMPRDESIVRPRSRCPGCRATLAWHDNLPLLSWILLGGKCRGCGMRISPRYAIVEIATALLFVAIWRVFAPAEAFAYTLFACGLVAATFIDFEHFIIPDRITLGSVLAGVFLSGMTPSLQNAERHSAGALWSLAGAAVGYATLRLVVEIGKKIFGVKRIEFPHPTEVFLTPEGLRFGDESEAWENIFSRESDELRFGAIGVRLGERTWDRAVIRVRWKEARVNDESFPLESLGELMAVTKRIEIPREAMGLGDVKFLAGIGAFLGPQAIFFVILISSILGSAIGLLMMLAAKRGWGFKIPYGPYLAAAALLWLFSGSAWWSAWTRGLSLF